MKHMEFDAAARALALAKQIMPAPDTEWSQAMQAELSVIAAPRARFSFALGCLMTAATARCRTRSALSMIGRGAIGLGAIIMSFYGLWWMTHVEPSPVTPVIAILCLCYGSFGLAALCSLKWLQLLSCAGLCGATAVLLLSILDLSLLPGITPRGLAALSFEICGIMCGLLFAATFLRLVDDPDGGANGLA